jgi:hypothetical protein
MSECSAFKPSTLYSHFICNHICNHPLNWHACLQSNLN